MPTRFGSLGTTTETEPIPAGCGMTNAGSLLDLREGLPLFLGELPRIVGVEPFYAFPAAVMVMVFMSFFIGTFLQLMWEDIPITEPL